MAVSSSPPNLDWSSNLDQTSTQTVKSSGDNFNFPTVNHSYLLSTDFAKAFDKVPPPKTDKQITALRHNRPYSSMDHSFHLQRDYTLEQKEHKWQMKFCPYKCKLFRITRSPSPTHSTITPWNLKQIRNT